MKRARIAYAGAIHHAISENAQLRLDDGRLVAEDSVIFLPPTVPAVILALGLNYTSHAKELDFQPPTEPLAFPKAPTSLVGHRGQTRRPADATFMHYECELAVIIGKTARSVPRQRAYEFIAGYSVANDYAIRDYLENYYRPNLRVKSRDEATPLGPWLVDAADIPNPMNLRLTTTVNGRLTQQGDTKDMVFDIPSLIEYFTGFMTLQPGDLILTGTPEGLANVMPGDEVVTEIGRVGRLVNTIVEDWVSEPRAQASGSS
jgi:5-oxopent-3-ene-1,2,5-tricarboxylate decarboxylase/2-hydroxyhepta-2,4-diene-1,7-dioate isomerase